MWIAGEFDGVQGVTSIDPDSLEVLETIAADSFGKGVSVDADGYVWRAGGPTATRIDPDTHEFAVYDGLDGAYTYSDMTGFAVANATGCPPVG